MGLCHVGVDILDMLDRTFESEDETQDLLARL
jgi:hypothetical protein